MEWISVKVSLPEDGQECWIAHHNGRITMGDFVNHEIFGVGFGSYDEFVSITQVKYWLPYFTPEPPKD